MSVRLLGFLIGVLILSACTQPVVLEIPDSVDPEEVELFTLSNAKDTSLYTADEIYIHIPKGAVVDSEGNPVDNYQLQFAGFMDAADAIASGLTTNSDSALLESSAIVYAQVSQGGQPLFIDPNKGVTLSIPEYYERGNLETFTKENSESSWQKTPEPVYLNTVDFNLLDFLPKGFRPTIKEVLNTAYSDEAVDSLYYAMEAYERKELILVTNVQGSERSEIFIWPKGMKHPLDEGMAHYGNDSTSYEPTITPAKIKVLKSEKLANTFIATRAFEQRMAVLHEWGCWGDELLKVYLQNLHQPLWVSDSIVYFHKPFDDLGYPQFKEFYEQRLTNTQGAPTISTGLVDWFELTLEDERARILKAQKRNVKSDTKALQRLIKQRKKTIKQRARLLKKREAYRMDRFDFKMTKSGWYNFATETRLEDLETFELTATIENGGIYNRTYAYIVNPKIFSLYALASTDKVVFDRGLKGDPHLLLWKNQQALLVGVGIDGPGYGYQQAEFQQRKVNRLSLELKPETYPNLKRKLKALPLKKRENSIMVDIKIAEKLVKQDSLVLVEVKKQQAAQAQLRKIFYAAYPCDHPPG